MNCVFDAFYNVCRYVLIDVVFRLTDYTNLFSPNDYQKNEDIIYKHFKDKYGKS